MSNKDNFGIPVDPQQYDVAQVPAFPTAAENGSTTPVIGPQPDGIPLHACVGLNCCQGADRYGTAGNPKTGMNECAGQGYCATTPDHTCHVKNSCRNQGGCGLYGTADELSHPASNECRAFGSCATPINAERFITNGPYQGTSVWKRAREVFEKDVYPILRQELIDSSVKEPAAIPETPGPAPAPFTKTGPLYQWISNDNKNRLNMTACGQSGMSGAGDCA